jgi:FKBP-type peptidyl-prolyl cis-trans isomerase SlyD
MAINKDQIVSILYEVKDVATNEVVDSNMNAQPLTFMMGRNQIIIGLENAISDMNMNESKDALVKAAEAYGIYEDNAVQTLPRDQFAGIDLQEGMTLYGQSEDGQTVSVTVKGFTDSEVNIDYNHPLAGKDLMFTVHITMVRDATPDELISGQPFENQQQSFGGSCGCGTGGDDSCSTDNTSGGSCGTGYGGGSSCGTGGGSCSTY